MEMGVRIAHLPDKVSDVPGKVTLLHGEDGVLETLGSQQEPVFCYFNRAAFWDPSNSNIRVGSMVRLNAVLVPNTFRQIRVPYLSRNVWREGSSLPSVLSLRLLEPPEQPELDHYCSIVPGLLCLLPAPDMEMDQGARLGAALVMQGIIREGPPVAKEPSKEQEHLMVSSSIKDPIQELSERVDTHLAETSQVDRKKKKKRKKSGTKEEPVKHLDYLHKLNDMIAELEKDVGSDQEVQQEICEQKKKKKKKKHKSPKKKAPEGISYPLPGVAYSTHQDVGDSSPQHIGFPDLSKLKKQSAWLGLAVAPGSVPTPIQPLIKVLEDCSPPPGMRESEEEEDESPSPVKKSIFTDLYDERPKSPDHDEALGAGYVGKANQIKDGEGGHKLSSLLQNKIFRKGRGSTDSNSNSRRNSLSESKEGRRSASTSRDKKSTNMSVRSRSKSKDTSSNRSRDRKRHSRCSYRSKSRSLSKRSDSRNRNHILSSAKSRKRSKSWSRKTSKRKRSRSPINRKSKRRSRSRERSRSKERTVKSSAVKSGSDYAGKVTSDLKKEHSNQKSKRNVASEISISRELAGGDKSNRHTKKIKATRDKSFSNSDSDSVEDEESLLQKRRKNRTKIIAKFDDQARTNSIVGIIKRDNDENSEEIPISVFEQQNENEEVPIVVSLDAEILHNSSKGSNFTQLGAAAVSKGGELVTFFRYSRTQLTSSLERLTSGSKREVIDLLRLKSSKFDVTHSGNQKINFKHPDMGEIEARKEKECLVALIDFLKSLKSPIILFTHLKDIVLPSVFSAFTRHDMLDQLTALTHSTCDLVSLARSLNMDHLWAGKQLPSLRSLASFVCTHIDLDDGHLPSDRAAALLNTVVLSLVARHELDMSRLLEKAGGQTVVEYMTVKYGVVQTARGELGDQSRWGHVEVAAGSEQWDRRLRIDLTWTSSPVGDQRGGESSRCISGTDKHEREEVGILQQSLEKRSECANNRPTMDVTWSEKSYNAFLPPKKVVIRGRTNLVLDLKVPALKPSSSQLLGKLALVSSLPEFTLCKIMSAPSTISQPRDSMFPVVQATFVNNEDREVKLDPRSINFAVASVKLESGCDVR